MRGVYRPLSPSKQWRKWLVSGLRGAEVEGAMSYREISSAQIVLSEPDTVRHFVREVRGARWGWLLDALQAIGDAVSRPRRGQPWPTAPAGTTPDPRLIALALVAVSAGVALCFVLAASPAPVPNAITASPIAGLPSALAPAPSPLPATAGPERVLDSEPHGALVYRAGSLIGTTPFLYETPPDDPLGTIELRLSGYRTEHRFVDAASPRVLVVALRRR